MGKLIDHRCFDCSGPQRLSRRRRPQPISAAASRWNSRRLLSGRPSPRTGASSARVDLIVEHLNDRRRSTILGSGKIDARGVKKLKLSKRR